MTFVGVLLNPAYRPAIIAIAVCYVIGLLVFGLYTRHVGGRGARRHNAGKRAPPING